MYEVQDSNYGVDFGQRESRSGDSTQGSYHVLLPDGRVQTVDYTADQGGYRPTVNYQGGSGGGGGGDVGFKSGRAKSGRAGYGGQQGGFGGGFNRGH